MYHRTRWTPEKIKQRLELIGPLVYRKQKTLPAFRSSFIQRKSEKPISTLYSLVSVSKPNVIVETIKRAEDGDFAIESAWETNLLEENESELSVENDAILLN